MNNKYNSKQLETCSKNVTEDENLQNSSLTIEYGKDDRLMTAQEVAEYLRIPHQSVLNMTCNGQLPYYKLGRRNRYKRSDLEKLLTFRSHGLKD